MRLLFSLIGLAVFLAVPCVHAQHSQEHRVLTVPCGSDRIPGYYYETVVRNLKPPGFQNALIKIEEGSQKRIVLLTDGDKFEIWGGAPEPPNNNINDFLHELDRACRLPVDPDDAARLIRMKWESRKLTSSQFAKIHSDFMVAALDYVSNARDRYIPLMSEKMLTMHLDAIVYPLVYENQTEEFELLVYHVPDHGDKKRPMFEWIQRLQILAEESFHKPFVTK